MADIYGKKYCDRCGRELIDENPNNLSLFVKKLTYGRIFVDIGSRNLDTGKIIKRYNNKMLCKDCIQSFYKWWNA